MEKQMTEKKTRKKPKATKPEPEDTRTGYERLPPIIAEEPPLATLAVRKGPHGYQLSVDGADVGQPGVLGAVAQQAARAIERLA